MRSKSSDNPPLAFMISSPFGNSDFSLTYVRHQV
jgi:hypothetical protein